MNKEIVKSSLPVCEDTRHVLQGYTRFEELPRVFFIRKTVQREIVHHIIPGFFYSKLISRAQEEIIVPDVKTILRLPVEIPVPVPAVLQVVFEPELRIKKRYNGRVCNNAVFSSQVILLTQQIGSGSLPAPCI